MTSSLKDLVNSTFRLMYYLNLQPSEVDNLTTYEMREYMRLLDERVTSENKKENSIVGSILKLISSRKSKGR